MLVLTKFPRPPGEMRLRRHLWAPPMPIWETAAFGGGERSIKKKLQKNNWGTMGTPYLGRRGHPGRAVSLRRLRWRKKKIGALVAPQMVLKT